MNRSSFAGMALLTSFVTLGGSGCSSDEPQTSPFPIAGAGPTAGTGATPMAGTSSGGSGAAGTPGTAGTGAGGAAGAAGTGTVGGGAAGMATGGAGAGAGGVAGGATGGGGAGGGSGMCPAAISSTTPCTAVVSCPGSLCGMHKLGSRSCSCAAASGTFECMTCVYAGGQEIVAKPAAPLENCAMPDSAMEDIVGCTKGMRCKSLDTTKDRFCACWDVAGGGTKYDCDSTPSAWD